MHFSRHSLYLKQEDHRLVKTVMRESGFVKYSDLLNPFNPVDDTVRYDRFKRKYERYLPKERQRRGLQ